MLVGAVGVVVLPLGQQREGLGHHQLLALFNPFPSDAVVTVTFDTDAGARAPGNYAAIVVPGNNVTVLPVSDDVTLRTEIATTVSVRSGRIIADQIQYSDGTQDTTKSLTVTPARRRPGRRGGSPTGRPGRVTRPRSPCRTRPITTSTSSCRCASTTPT